MLIRGNNSIKKKNDGVAIQTRQLMNYICIVVVFLVKALSYIIYIPQN